jgi:hypothetical protein
LVIAWSAAVRAAGGEYRAMQCPNCNFNNMPGTQRCFRCATSLVLHATDLVLTPPRAGKRTKVLRRWFHWRPMWYQVRDSPANLSMLTGRLGLDTDNGFVDFGHLFGIDAAIKIYRVPKCLCAIIPGLAHLMIGAAFRGALYAIPFWLLLGFGLLTVGSIPGSVALGLAAAIHLASIIDIWIMPEHSQTERFVHVPIWALAYLLALYLPVAWIVTSGWTVRRFLLPSRTFATGDTILFRTLTGRGGDPRPGQVVLFDLGIRQAPDPSGVHRILRGAGECIDRIVAGPGSTVLLSKGKLYVDGRPAQFLPLNPSSLPAELRLEVPPDCVCILPSTDTMVPAAMAWQQYSFVRPERILGRAVVRNYPLSRWSWY